MPDIDLGPSEYSGGNKPSLKSRAKEFWIGGVFRPVIGGIALVPLIALIFLILIWTGRLH